MPKLKVSKAPQVDKKVMVVAVRQKHIANSKCRLSQKCMIAAAIKDVNSDVSYVSVKTNGITITKRPKGSPATRTLYTVPTIAARNIIRFDTGQDVRPFTFAAKMVEKKVIPPVSLDAVKRKSRNLIESRAKAKADEAAGIIKPQYGIRVGGV